MQRRTPQSIVTLFLSVSLVAFSLIGCHKTDLTGYQQASQKRKSTAEPPAESTVLASAKSEAPAETKDESSVISPVAVTPQEVESFPASALAPLNVVDGADVRALMNVAKQEIRAVDANASSVNPLKATEAPVTEPHKIELLVKEKTFRKEAQTGALRVSFDDLDLLKVLNMEPVTDNAKELMPDWLLGLDGKKIRLRGFMYPTYDTEGIEKFVLARDNQICCFGRDPKVYDLVQVTMKAGKTTNYIPAVRAFDVVGIFQINMMSEEGKPYGLYFIDQAEVIDR